MPKLALSMIVRDEAEDIERCLESALPFIDYWVIVDTGSLDDTPAIVTKTLEGIPGELHHSLWQGFGHNRTELFELARGKADYLLLLDADMAVEYDGPLPELTLDVYNGSIKQGPYAWALPFLVKSDKPWRYVGVAHSYIDCHGEEWTEAVLPGLSVHHFGIGAGVAKIERDIALLSEEHRKNPTDPRTTFYLAQSHKDLGHWAEAIQFYRARAHMTDGWPEEQFIARYQLGELLCTHSSFSEGATELLAAWKMRPHRVEPLRALAEIANNVANKYPYPPDLLFVEPSAYRQPAVEAIAEPSGLTSADVSAVIVTRGNIDLGPILESLPYEDIVVWDNSKRPIDLKILGRYHAALEAKNEIVYFQDDDIVFTAHDELLAAYEPGVIVANMNQSWVDACGYHDMVMLGAGSVCDKSLLWPALERYLSVHPRDEDFMLETDFIVGTLVPGKKVDLGYELRSFADDADRLYQQPGQFDRKELARARAREIRDEQVAA